MNQNIGQQQPVNIGLEQTTPIECGECGCQVFNQRLIIRKVSAIYAGGQEQLVHIPIFVCDSCNTVVSEFLPEELRDKNLYGNKIQF